MSRLLAVVAASVLVVGCSGGGEQATSSGGGSTEPVLPSVPLVLNAQGNHLDAYLADAPHTAQRLLTSAAEDPEGTDVNAQLCFFPDRPGRFIAGEDTGQPERPAGWGLFQLEGTGPGDLRVTQVGKLTPTYQPGAQPENYGCGVLSDGRIVTTDLGGQRPGDPGNGQLIVWFGEPEGTGQAYCKVDVELATAQSIMVGADDAVYVASARPPTSGVWRYTDLPTGPDEAGGCGRTDVTGAPLADDVTRTRVLAPGANDILSPTGVAASPEGGFYVSSVITGVINEYDGRWRFVRTILAPPPGAAIGPTATLPTGTPLGIGVAPDGSIWYADIGIVDHPEDGLGPGAGTGSVRRIPIVDGEPGPPETVADGLSFPDGIGVYLP